MFSLCGRDENIISWCVSGCWFTILTYLFKKKLVWGDLILGLLFLGFYRFSFIFKQRSFIKTSPQLVINVPTMVTFNVIYCIH
jgi:hypothetical protein